MGSLYAGQAGRRATALRRRAGSLDKDWAAAQTLSRMALRAVRSTRGVSCVLVGMRKPAYVSDVLSELHRPVQQGLRTAAWQALKEKPATSA